MVIPVSQLGDPVVVDKPAKRAPSKETWLGIALGYSATMGDCWETRGCVEYSIL